jgi:hypothetical protein
LATKTEERTARKRQDAATRRKREEDIQELKIVRDKRLGQLADDRAAALANLDSQYRAAVRQTWDTFKDAMRKLRKRDKDQT